MPTVPVTVSEYNDLRLRTALAAWRREAWDVRQKPGGNGVVPGRPKRPFAEPPPERKFEMAKCGSATPRKGGRPALSPAERVARRRATWRAYQARRRTGGRDDAECGAPSESPPAPGHLWDAMRALDQVATAPTSAPQTEAR
jgi:hypothetical protein